MIATLNKILKIITMINTFIENDKIRAPPTTHPVHLYVYDISVQEVEYNSFGRRVVKGTFGEMFHSSIIAYDREYYVQNDGIYVAEIPGQAGFGVPVSVIELGESTVSELEFHEYIDKIAHQHKEGKYDLVHNNCNDFAEKLYRFLRKTDRKLPKWVNRTAQKAKKNPIVSVANFLVRMGVIALGSTASTSSFGHYQPAQIWKWHEFKMEEFDIHEKEQKQILHDKINQNIYRENTDLNL